MIKGTPTPNVGYNCTLYDSYFSNHLIEPYDYKNSTDSTDMTIMDSCNLGIL